MILMLSVLDESVPRRCPKVSKLRAWIVSVPGWCPKVRKPVLLGKFLKNTTECKSGAIVHYDVFQNVEQ